MHVGNTQSIQSRRSSREPGFTLVELICAVAILAITVTVLFYGFDNGFAILRVTRDDLRATQILLEKTEALRLYTWAQLTNAQTSQGTFQVYYDPNRTSGTLYSGTLTTTDPATNIVGSAAYASTLHLITITVNWTNNIGNQLVPHSRQMQTLSCQSGMINYLGQ